jgi:curved DNA-binding protein
MPSRDLYDILGISRTASADEIRKAHRKLALQYHPDRNKAADAPKRFSEIQEAYETLSDDAKRRQYDDFIRLGGSPESFGSASAAGAGPQAGPFGGSWRPGGGNGGASGGDAWAGADAATFESVFSDIFGGGRGGRTRGGRGRARERQQADIHVPLDLAIKGGKVSVDLGGRKVEVEIPAGTEDGDMISVPGDLLTVLTVHFNEHAWLRIEGRDLSFELPVSIVEATLGASVDAPLPAGGSLTLKVPPGTPSGKRMRIAGKGLPAGNGRAAGDLFVEIAIVPPKAVNDLTRQLLEEVGRSIESPRARAPWQRA